MYISVDYVDFGSFVSLLSQQNIPSLKTSLTKVMQDYNKFIIANQASGSKPHIYI